MFIIKQSYIIKPVEVKILLVCINLKKKIEIVPQNRFNVLRLVFKN